MTTTIAPAEAVELDDDEAVHPLVALLERRPELGCLAQAGVRLFQRQMESA